MIHRESAEEYHARQAVSASFCWELLQECPAQAWFNSCFNPQRPPEATNGDLDFGKIVHIAALEERELGERVAIIDHGSFRTKVARELRDEVRASGKVPILFASARERKSTAYGYEDVRAARKALEESAAAEMLFGPGESEVSYTWDFHYYQTTEPARYEARTASCKARADRIVPGKIVDLKTAASASPDAFGRAMARDGHHLRAAWYLDGWLRGRHPDYQKFEGSKIEYLFVVVGKPEPHLVQTYRLDDRALEWGRRLYRKALSEIRRSRETGVWSGYDGQDRNSIITASLPAFAERQLAEMEMEDLL